MELKETRLDLARAMAAASTAAQAADPFRAARQLLIHLGAEALGMAPDSVSGIADIVAHAARAPASPSRRAFAALIADALAAHGLLSARSAQARLDRDQRRSRLWPHRAIFDLSLKGTPMARRLSGVAPVGVK